MEYLPFQRTGIVAVAALQLPHPGRTELSGLARESTSLLDGLRCDGSQLVQDAGGRVFTTELGAPIFPDSITAWFSKFIARSGLPKVTVHSLRHTYASLMIADGTPLVVVSKALGHAQPSTTANIYAHVIASAEAKAMETFDRFDDVVAVKKAE